MGKKRVEIEQRFPGEWVEPVHKGFIAVCCDCGLAHTVNFAVRDGQVQMQAFRNDEVTEQEREERNIEVVTDEGC